MHNRDLSLLDDNPQRAFNLQRVPHARDPFYGLPHLARPVSCD